MSCFVSGAAEIVASPPWATYINLFVELLSNNESPRGIHVERRHSRSNQPLGPMLATLEIEKVRSQLLYNITFPCIGIAYVIEVFVLVSPRSYGTKDVSHFGATRLIARSDRRLTLIILEDRINPCLACGWCQDAQASRERLSGVCRPIT